MSKRLSLTDKIPGNFNPTIDLINNELYNHPENTIPRRCYLDKLTPAEKAIYDAIDAVEKIGADSGLTDVVIMLAEAKEKLSDYVDKNL